MCLRPQRHRVGRLISHSKQMNGAVNSRSSCFCLVSARENRLSILLGLPFFLSYSTLPITNLWVPFPSADHFFSVQFVWCVCEGKREKTRRQQREPYSDIVQDGKAIPVYTLLCTRRTHGLPLVSEMTRSAQRRRGSYFFLDIHSPKKVIDEGENTTTRCADTKDHKPLDWYSLRLKAKKNQQIGEIARKVQAKQNGATWSLVTRFGCNTA